MAQNGGTRSRTFHGEMGRFRESQGWTTACNGMPERDGKDQGEDSPQDEEKWHKTAEQGAEHFMVKWIVAGKTKAGLRHACSGMPERDTGRTKKKIAQSKRARAGSLDLVD